MWIQILQPCAQSPAISLPPIWKYISSLFMHICIGVGYGYKLYCLLGFSINLLPIGHSGVHIGEEHLQCSWCCWTWFGCLTGIGLLVDWLVYWYWLVGWLVLVCWLVGWMPGVGWLADWLVFESGLSVRGRRSKASSLFLSLPQSPFYKYQFKDVNVLAEICKQ